MLKLGRPRSAELAGALLTALFAGATVLWLFLDRVPPNWDDAWYLTNSLTVYDGLVSGGIPGYWRELDSAFGFKAPLIAGLPAPLYLIFGRRWHAAYLVNVACLLILCWVLYRIATRWWSERAGVFAIAISGTLPLLYGLSRWYMVEYPLAALLGISIWLLIESGNLEQRGKALSFGAVCGLGMLLKASFAAFILAPFVYFLARSRHRLRSLALTALPCLLLAMPWYARHLRPTLANALDAGFGQPAAIQGTGPIFALRTMTTYISHVIVNGISVYYAILTVPLILWAAARGRLPRKSFAVLLLWLLPFALFLFGGNKDIRYIAPLLPCFALLLAGLLDSTLPRNLPGASLAILLLALPVTHLFSVSFGVPYRVRDLTYARRFSRDEWPHHEILKAIAADTSLKPGEKRMLLVGADRNFLNANNIELTVTALQLPFQVETTAHERSLDTLRQRLEQASYFLYKEGGEPESPVFNPFIKELVQAVTSDPRYSELLARPLPDQGIARVFRNSRTQVRSTEGAFIRNATHPDAGLAIDFGGMLSLATVSSSQTPAAIIVRFQWRCLKPPDRDYWCFTHLIDSEGKILTQFDHRLLGGEPPLLSWRAGDTATEEIRLQLPPAVATAGLRLRFGLYDPPSGDRLQVRPLQSAAAREFVLADHATALLCATLK